MRIPLAPDESDDEFGPNPRRLLKAFEAALERFNHRPTADRHHGFDLRDARRVVLLAALAFNPDFRGAELGLDWPWNDADSTPDWPRGRSWTGPMLKSWPDDQDELLAQSIARALEKLAELAEPHAAAEAAAGSKPVPRPATTGMPWQEAKRKAVQYVKAEGYPGLNKLAKKIGCAKGTIKKAIKQSPYLKARKAEYEAEKGHIREVPMSDAVLDHTPQETEASAIERLVKESRADEERQKRKYQAWQRQQAK